MSTPKDITAEQVHQLCIAHDSFAICAHVFPDADAIGSTTALAQWLQALGKDVWAFSPAQSLTPALATIPATSDVLMGSDHIPQRPWDVLFIVDCAGLDRIGDMQPLLDHARTVVVIDHHSSNLGFGDQILLDTAEPSTCSILWNVFSHGPAELITTDIAHSLYSGIMMDTGSFRWGGESALLHAYQLSAYGIDRARIARELVDDQSLHVIHTIADLARTIDVVPCTEHVMVATCVVSHPLEGALVEKLVSTVRSVAEADISLVAIQQRPGVWKISMRSKHTWNVRLIASACGGGGHDLAAGCDHHGELEEFQQRFTELLTQQVRDHDR